MREILEQAQREMDEIDAYFESDEFLDAKVLSLASEFDKLASSMEDTDVRHTQA